MAADKKIILVEKWDLMRKFIVDAVGKLENVVIEKEFTSIDSVREYLMGNEASVVICDIPANSEQKVFDGVRMIKDVKPDVKVILSTLTYSKKLEEEAKKYGADRIWQKDVSEKLFLEQLMSVL